MIIDCISDLHGFFPKLEGGDLLIVAGDLTASDTPVGHLRFIEWLKSSSYKVKVFIGGNHDSALERYGVTGTSGDSCFYLCDSGTKFEGLKVWGSPYTPEFGDWAFMEKRGEAIKRHWALIPEDTDILVTHGPPHGVLDECFYGDTNGSKSVGCKDLLRAVCRIRPKLHVFGHIHEGYGQRVSDGIHFVNCSHVNENYKPVNAPIRVVL